MAISNETRAAAHAALHEHEQATNELHRKLTALHGDADESKRIEGAIATHTAANKAFSDDILGIVGTQ